MEILGLLFCAKFISYENLVLCTPGLYCTGAPLRNKVDMKRLFSVFNFKINFSVGNRVWYTPGKSYFLV